jgi:hypothetical protein
LVSIPLLSSPDHGFASGMMPDARNESLCLKIAPATSAETLENRKQKSHFLFVSVKELG